MQFMPSGIVFPNNVEVKTITIDTVPANTNITIANPFGRADMSHLVGITFGTVDNAKCSMFICNPSSGMSDNASNRKISNLSDKLTTTSYYAVVSMTNEEITLRNSGTTNYMPNTYYLFAW